jgi:tetratricopeptide (TPR) repeat protein
MGGVGKTELALQYALQSLTGKQYPGGICWLNARSLDLGTQIVNFARTYLKLQLPDGLELPNQVAHCWHNWLPGDVLVVLDDVTDDEQVKPYLPPTSNPRFKVLMTTRLQLSKPIKRLDLPMLTPKAALDMLRSYIEDERVNNQLKVAEKLCQWLGFLPLGLELVGRYLERKPDLSLEEMLARLEAKRLEQLALKKPKSEATMTAQLGVRDAFELSWQELDEPAQQLGLCLSLFAVAPIPWQLVELCLPDIDSEELEEIRDYGLVYLNLVMAKGEKTYQLHELIREFFQDKREESAEAEELKRGFCRTMVAVAKDIPKTPIQSEIATFTPTIPHLAEAAATQTAWLDDEDLIWSFVGLVQFYNGQGDYNEALPWSEQCLSSTKARLGENHPDVAASLNNLAYLYDSQGRYDKAEPLYLQALELRQRLLGENHPLIAKSLNNLAALYKSQGRYEQAEPLFVQALELSQHHLGENHPDVAASLNNLAYLYNAQGRYDEAEPLLVQALELWQHHLGENHPFIAKSLNNLAYLYNAQGRYDEAEPLFVLALELSKRLLGTNHPDVATSLNNLALLYNDQGRYDEAEPLFVQALELWQHHLGENHPFIAKSLHNLAYLYKAQGRYDEAEPLFVQALELWQHHLGENHPDVATSLNNLAGLYKSQGRYEQAEPLYEQALELCERVLGVNHPNTVTIRENLQILRDHHLS